MLKALILGLAIGLGIGALVWMKPGTITKRDYIAMNFYCKSNGFNLTMINNNNNNIKFKCSDSTGDHSIEEAHKQLYYRAAYSLFR